MTGFASNGNVLILGATSDLAISLAGRYAAAGYSITLAARDVSRIDVIARDMVIRYKVPIYTFRFDALDFAGHPEFYRALNVAPDIAICVFGYLGDQQTAQENWRECATIIDSNFTGAVSILNLIASDFEKRKAGTIIGISSVAGDRGRQSNYFYGSAKAGFTAYLSGLRNRLFKSNVHVLTVKPGFMKTRMIEGMKTPGPLTGNTDTIANMIFKAAGKRRNVIYVLPVWRLIMWIIRTIPEGIFKKLKL